MKDLHGIEIKIGDTVTTRQPTGGIFNPASPVTGKVIKTPEKFKSTYSGNLFLEYKKIYNGSEITCYIDLQGKINEIIK